MTRQFHARIRNVSPPKARVPGPYTLSFTCFRAVASDELVELCDPRNAMRALVIERR
jgi:hypothetical protein